VCEPTAEDLATSKELGDKFSKSPQAFTSALKSTRVFDVRPEDLTKRYRSQALEEFKALSLAGEKLRTKFEDGWHEYLLEEENRKADEVAESNARIGVLEKIWAVKSKGDLVLEVVKEGARQYVPVSETAGRKHLETYGIDPDEIDGKIIEARLGSRLEGSMNIAGIERRIVESKSGGDVLRVLNDSCPDITHAPGECLFITTCLDQLCGNDLQVRDRLLLAMKNQLVAMEKGRWRASPIVIVVGDEGHGKSFLSFLIAKVVGGYGIGDAKLYFTGAEENLALVSSFVWAGNDMDIPFGKRDAFWEKLKAVYGDAQVVVKGLYSNKFQAEPHRMVMLSWNPSANLGEIIPPFDDRSGFKDKVIGFVSSKITCLGDREENQSRIDA